jgi:hypothetical protein
VFEIVTGGSTSGSDSDLLYVWWVLETCNSNLQCTGFVLCDSWSSKHNVNRWWSGGDCAVSAYSENGAVWGEVRLGRREVGANTYTAVVVVDSVVRRGCCCGAYRQVWRFSGVAGVRLKRRVYGRLCCNYQ